MLYNIIASEIPDSCAARPANGTSSRRKRKPGRPKLPRGNAKNKIVPIRFTKAEAEQLAKAAKANKRLPKQTKGCQSKQSDPFRVDSSHSICRSGGVRRDAAALGRVKLASDLPRGIFFRHDYPSRTIDFGF